MPETLYGLVDAVRAAINMAYAALGVSRLNAQKISDLEERLKNIEHQVDRLLAEYEKEKSRAQGQAISAGKWRAKAGLLQTELDRLTAQISVP